MIDIPILLVCIVIAGIIGILIGLSIGTASMERRAAQKGAAHFHPVTKKFTWGKFP